MMPGLYIWHAWLAQVAMQGRCRDSTVCTRSWHARKKIQETIENQELSMWRARSGAALMHARQCQLVTLVGTLASSCRWNKFELGPAVEHVTCVLLRSACRYGLKSASCFSARRDACSRPRAHISKATPASLGRARIVWRRACTSPRPSSSHGLIINVLAAVAC